MTKQQPNQQLAVMQQALEALEREDKISGYANNKKVIAALRAAIEQAKLQHPEGTPSIREEKIVNPGVYGIVRRAEEAFESAKQRQWVGLTMNVKSHDHPDYVGGWKWTNLELAWINDRIEKAVIAEREACAKLAEEPFEFVSEEAHKIAASIRARTNDTPLAADHIADIRKMVASRGI